MPCEIGEAQRGLDLAEILDLLEDKRQVISNALDVFLTGFERVFSTAGGHASAPVKTAGRAALA